MAQPFGSNLGPGETYLQLPKAPPKPAVDSAFKVKLPSVKNPTVHHLSTRHTIPRIGSTSKSTSSPIFGGPAANHLFSSSTTHTSVRSDYTPPSKPTFSTLQKAEIAAAKPKPKSSGGGGISGFLGAALNNPVGHAIETAANYASRPMSAAAALAREDLSPQHGHSLSRGFHEALQELEGHPTVAQAHGGKTHATYFDALFGSGEHNSLKKYLGQQGTTGNRIEHGISAAADIGLDPLNLVGGAGVYSKVGESAFKVTRGLSELDRAAQGARGASDLASYARLAHAASDVAPATSGHLLNHVAEMEAKGLHDLPELTAEQTAQHIEDTSKLTQASRAVQAEAKSNMNRYFGIRVGSKSANITLKTPIKTGTTLAERLGRTSKIGKAVNSVAAAVKPGYLNPVGHELAITAKHAAESRTMATWKTVWKEVSSHAKLPVKDREDALAAVADTKGIVGVESRKIDNAKLTAALEKAGFTGDRLTKAKSFVRSWHTAMEHLREADSRAGVVYKHAAKMDEIHVPHDVKNELPALFAKKGSPTAQKGIERYGQQTTYANLLKVARNGGIDGKKIVTDPLHILSDRAAQGAVAQSHEAVRNVLRQSFGTPLRAFDSERAASVEKRIAKLESQRADHIAAKGASRDERAVAIMQAGKKRAAGYRVGKTASDALERSYKDAVAKAHLTHSRNVNQAEKALGKLDGEVRRVTALKAVKSMKRVKIPEGHVKVEDLKTPVRDDLGNVVRDTNGKAQYVHTAVPKEIHDQVARVMEATTDAGAQTELANAFRKGMQAWKFGATVLNPGYRVKNTISDMWNMFVSGVPAAAIPPYVGKAVKLQVAIKQASEKLAKGETLSQSEVQAAAMARTMYDHGILSGQFMGDVAHLVNRASGRGKLRVDKAAYRGLLSGNIAAENNTRIAHFLYRLDHGMNADAAAEQVRMAHFDYEDLTSQERKLKRYVIPFYTWTRKNIPFQIKSMVENPARFEHAYRTLQGSESVSGKSPHDVIGTALDYYPTAFKAGGGYLHLPLGIEDVINAGNPGQELQNAVGPQYQLLYELATGKQFGTGDAISGPAAAHQMTPAPGILASLLSHVGLGGTTERMGPNGKPMHGPGINNTLANLINELPIGGLALSQNPIDEANKATGLPGDANNGRLLSYLTGLNYIKPKAQREEAIASVVQSDSIKSAIKQLRDEGKLPESKYKKSHSYYQQLLDKYVNSSITRGR